MSRAPWRKGTWTPEEIAAALHRRHDALLADLRSQTAMSGIPSDALEEIFIDAMHAVVIEQQKPILNEEHLRGAFFASARHRAMRRWEGRHLVGVGGMTRVHDFDVAAESTASEDQGEGCQFPVASCCGPVVLMHEATEPISSLDRRP